MRLIHFIRAYWRCLLAVLLALALGVAGGRWTAPEKVRVEERWRTEWKDRVDWWGGWTEKRVQGPVRVRVVERDRPAAPGSPCPPIRERVTTIDDAGSTDERMGSTGGRREGKGRSNASRAVEPVPELRPRWHVSALAGASLASAPGLVAGDLRGLEVGAGVQWMAPRPLPPLSAGLWASTRLGDPLGGFTVRLSIGLALP